MSDDIQRAKNEVIEHIATPLNELSDQLKAKYGPGSMSDIPEADNSSKSVIFTTELDNLFVATMAAGALALGVRKFVRTYKQIDHVRKSYANFYF